MNWLLFCIVFQCFCVVIFFETKKSHGFADALPKTHYDLMLSLNFPPWHDCIWSHAQPVDGHRRANPLWDAPNGKTKCEKWIVNYELCKMIQTYSNILNHFFRIHMASPLHIGRIIFCLLNYGFPWRNLVLQPLPLAKPAYFMFHLVFHPNIQGLLGIKAK